MEYTYSKNVQGKVYLNYYDRLWYMKLKCKNALSLFKIFFSTVEHRSDCKVYINNELQDGSCKILNFINPGTEAHVLRSGHICHMVKLINFFEILLSTAERRSDKLNL